MIRFKVTTFSDHIYEIEKEGKSWYIYFRGKRYLIEGFATWPVAQEQIQYKSPEQIKGYEVFKEPDKNLYIIFIKNKDRFGHTNRIKKMRMIE